MTKSRLCQKAQSSGFSGGVREDAGAIGDAKAQRAKPAARMSRAPIARDEPGFALRRHSAFSAQRKAPGAGSPS